jgi:tetratricopeptide (TPR) repeat protein
MARLDRLATVKGVAQLGATLGREFSYALLQAVSPWDEGALRLGLQQLVEAEFLYQRGVPPQATYLFKHALIQEAAYQSLLKSTRQQYHQRAAQMMADRFPDTAETQPELLAHHYTEAGLASQAIPYWLRAGERAIQRSANLEAISHITKGLKLLKSLPETHERTQQELMLQIALGMPLIATKGYAAPEVGQVYTRAQELCRQVGDTTALFPVLRGLWVFHVQQGKLQRAHELGEQLLLLAQDQQDPAPLLEAHRALGSTSYFLGDFAQGRAYQEQGIALYDLPRHRFLALLYGQDPGVVCKSFAAVTLWSLGYPDAALKRSHEALILARDLSHPFSLGYALFFAARLYQHRQEGRLAQEQADALITLSREQGFAQMLAMGTILQGWAWPSKARERRGLPGCARV